MSCDHEMTLAEAVRVCREEAAKRAGEVRIALNALADFTAHETAKRTRKRNARRRARKGGAR